MQNRYCGFYIINRYLLTFFALSASCQNTEGLSQLGTCFVRNFLLICKQIIIPTKRKYFIFILFINFRDCILITTFLRCFSVSQPPIYSSPFSFKFMACCFITFYCLCIHTHTYTCLHIYICCIYMKYVHMYFMYIYS